MQKMVKVKFIRRYCEYEIGDVISVSKSTAGILEATRVAIRVDKAHAIKRKPITAAHTVQK